MPLTWDTGWFCNIFTVNCDPLHQDGNHQASKTGLFQPHSSITQLTCAYFVFVALNRGKLASSTGSQAEMSELLQIPAGYAID